MYMKPELSFFNVRSLRRTGSRSGPPWLQEFRSARGRLFMRRIRIVVILLVGAALSVLVYLSPSFFVKKNPDDPTAHFNVGGTSVVFFMMDKWESAYRKEKKIKITYDSTGS